MAILHVDGVSKCLLSFLLMVHYLWSPIFLMLLGRAMTQGICFEKNKKKGNTVEHNHN